MSEFDLDYELDMVLNALSSPESGYESPERTNEPNVVRDYYGTFAKTMFSYLEILEQPQPLYRFRYQTEFKENPHGPVQGENSTKPNKTFPTVKLHNYNKKAIIRCWLCVSDKKEPHVHHLLTKSDGKGIRSEPHDIVVDTKNNFTAVFEGLNIIHAVIKKKETVQCFHKKKCHMKSGYNLPKELDAYDERALKQEVKDLEKNKAVLYFEAFDFDTHDKITELVSHKIKNSKNPNTSTLKIARQSVTFGGAPGGTNVMIFVEKVPKDIKVQFFEVDQTDQVIWEAFAEIDDLWHQVAIAFRTPSYKDVNIQEDAKVYFKIIRESDNTFSNEMEFTYQPDYRNQFNYSEPLLSKKRRFEQPIQIDNSQNAFSPISSSEFSYSNDEDYSLTEISNNVWKDPRLSIAQENPNILTLDNFSFCTDSELGSDIISGIRDTREEIMDLPLFLDSDSAGIPDSELQIFAGFQDDPWGTFCDHWIYQPRAGHNSSSIFRRLDTLLVTVLEFIYTSLYILYIISKCTLKTIWHKMLSLKDSGKDEDLVKNSSELKGEYIAYLLARDLFKAISERSNPHNFHETLKKIKNHKVKPDDLRNAYDKTPLHMAIEKERPQYIKPLLDAGFNVNAVDVDYNSALHLAIMYNTKDFIIEHLVSAGADLKLKNNGGETPLHLACRFKRCSQVNLLIMNDDASTKYQSAKSGDFPLHVAVKCGSLEIAEFLLKRGAAANSKNYGNYTPLDFAVQAEDEKMVSLLLNYMNPKERINVYIVDVILTKVQSDKMFKLLEDYMQKSEEDSLCTKDESDLYHSLNEKCNLRKRAIEQDTQV